MRLFPKRRLLVVLGLLIVLTRRYRKFVASSTSKNPVDAFIDPEGYRTFFDAAEAEFRSGRVH